VFSPFNLNKPNPFEGLDFNSICYFDTETTGLHPQTSQIVEIAAIKGDEKFYKKIHLTDEIKAKIEREKQNFEKQTKKDKTVEELLMMSGYHNTTSDSSEKKALEEFVNFCKNSAVLLAHNASFDMKMINQRCKMYGIEHLKNIPVYDTLAFSRRFFVPALITIEQTSKTSLSREKAKVILDKITKSYYKSGQRLNVSNSLSSLIGALRGSVGNWHQAMSDVEMLKDLVENFFKLMFDKHYNTIKDKYTFKKYYMRNSRFEDRMRQNDKKSPKNKQ
jgi:DNA polymerase III epsilon subunit-like protein